MWKIMYKPVQKTQVNSQSSGPRTSSWVLLADQRQGSGIITDGAGYLKKKRGQQKAHTHTYQLQNIFIFRHDSELENVFTASK